MRGGTKKKKEKFRCLRKKLYLCTRFQKAADMAQLVEHFIRNERVRGSSPRVGSKEGRFVNDVIYRPAFSLGHCSLNKWTVLHYP